MAPVNLPARPPVAPQISGQRQPTVDPQQSSPSKSAGFEPAAYKQAEKPPIATATAPTTPVAAPPAAPHTFTLQTLSAYAGVLVGQIERNVAPLGATPAGVPHAEGPPAKPEPPGSRLNIKV